MAALKTSVVRWHRQAVQAVLRSLACPRCLVTAAVSELVSERKWDRIDISVLRAGLPVGHVFVGVSRDCINLEAFSRHVMTSSVLSKFFVSRTLRAAHGRRTVIHRRRPKFRKFATYARKLLIELDDMPAVEAVMTS